jgi:uncharacterized protein YycO
VRHHLTLVAALAAIALAVPPALGSPLARSDEAHHPAGWRVVDPADLGRLEPGDVVFLSAPKALWARLASQWSLPRFHHGHVGMVIRDRRGGVLVVHAAGDPAHNRAIVRAVSLAKFLEEAESASVFRMRTPAAARAAAAEAEGFARRRVPFDTDFSLQSRDRLYCSELVWRAMSTALDRDVVPNKFSDYGRPTIRLSDLETSADLRLVARARAPATAAL